MRHRQFKLSFNRFTSWHKATLNSMARSLLIYQSIKTTKTKALAVRPLIDKLIGLAKENSLTAKRQAYKILCDHRLVKLLFDDIGKRFGKSTSGFTRIIKLGFRRGDSAEMVILEFTEIIKKEIKKSKKEKEQKEEKPRQADSVAVKEAGEEKKAPDSKVFEKPPITKKPAKKFLGGIKGIFKKKSDAL